MPKTGNKILIIDYEPRGIKQLSDPLEGAGFEICLAKDGIRGIEAFKSEEPDMVLIEAMLPKRHGFEVCQEIKSTEHGRQTPVVIVTSVYKGRKYRSQAIHQHGCDEFLEKPISPEVLLATVTRFLGALPTVPVTPPEPAVEAATPVPPAAPKPAPPAPKAAAPKPAPRAAPDALEIEITDCLNQVLGEPEGTGGGSG